MKLKNKINVYTGVMFICLLVLVNSSIYFLFSSMMHNRELNRIIEEASQATSGIHSSELDVPVQDLLRAYVPTDGLLQIVGQDGQTDVAVESSSQVGLRDLPITFFEREEQKIIEYNETTYVFVSVPIVWVAGEIATLQMTVSIKPIDDMLRILRLVLFAVTILATLPVLLSARIVGNFITRPITTMIQTMHDIQKNGQFKRLPLPKKTKDELYIMGETFNKMMDLLEINYEKQGQFISNASHELKTPLTVIESYASLLKRRGREQPEVFDESVHAILSEADRMRDLTQQLLLQARHNEHWTAEMNEITLTPLIEEIVKSFKKAYHREVEIEIDRQIVVQTDKQVLKQLIYILMDNARKYSEDVIEVKLKKKEKLCVIEINDYGIGIPPKELEKIFDRFYRVDQARERKKGGFGLGLSLAKELSEAIGAKLHIDSLEGYGTKAKISLPLFKSK